jgi:hypothetical protein
MANTTKPTIKLSDIREDAQLAFWAEVVKHLPLAESGDFDPRASFDLDAALEEAITKWWYWNASMHYDLQLSNGVIIDQGTGDTYLLGHVPLREISYAIPHHSDQREPRR